MVYARSRRDLFRIYGTLGACIAALMALLSFPVALPIGESFWDTYIYIDGAHRMAIGQDIYRDFHAPVGPLNYVLFNALESLFPDGNVVFVIQWSLMLVTVPAIAVICWHALARGPAVAFALLLPYLLFSVLPFNDSSWNAFPGVDGFAYYNRHAALLIYLLVASLFFVRSQVALVVLVSGLLLALAFLKINGFMAAGMILAVALITRRIGARAAIVVAVLCLAVTGLIELRSGVVSAYVASVLRLIDSNSSELVIRILTTGTARFDIIFTSSLLAAYLLWSRRRGSPDLVRSFDRDAPRVPHPNRLDRDWVWAGTLIAANILFESQNFGGAAFISLWPLLVVLFLGRAPAERMRLSPLVVLIGLIAAPPVVGVVHSAAHAAASSIRDVRLDAEHLPAAMSFRTKALTLEAAEKSRPILAAGRETYQRYADAAILPAYWLYFDHQFQLNVLETMDEVIAAIHAREARLGLRYDVIDLRDFANPIPAIMGRIPAKGVSIGGDPFRTVLPLTEAEAEMLSRTDLVLIPTCPVTMARRKLLSDYAHAYEGFNRVQLTPCFDALEHPDHSS
ncbi:hypothetical protein LL06_13890 [Hoeflea sp. BAL378]|nr:hypothetical protein LL06_13890 [Hoeflea sp. BAL378]